MYTMPSNIDSVLTEFPKVKKWLKTIGNKILKKEIDYKNIVIYYSYGFFVPKDKDINTDELYKMKFKKRLKIEFGKVRVDITLKIDDFIMTNRIDDIPEDIKKIVTELTKVKMMIEGDFHQNENVINSIPEVDTAIIQYKIVKEYQIDDNDLDLEKEILDLDVILDKIKITGLESLTKNEKDFLDNSSKN